MMKFLRSSLVVVGLLSGAAMLSGCPLLAVAGFGYSGYQYHEKEGVFAPGQPLGGPGPADKTDKSSTSHKSAPAPSANDVE
jgi:hypothetical protein